MYAGTVTPDAGSGDGISDLKQLTLGQAALLAGLPQAPSKYDPVVNPDAAKARRQDVLKAMVEL